MTADSERNTSDDGVEEDSTPTPVGSPNSFIDSSQTVDPDAADLSREEESPELLRYRADSLLDEMMLSAVDVSAADYGGSDEGGGFEPEDGPFDAHDSYADSYNAESRDFDDSAARSTYTPNANGNGAYGNHSNGASTSQAHRDSRAHGTAPSADSAPGQAGAAGSYASQNGAHAPDDKGMKPDSPQAAADRRPWQNGASEADVAPQPNPEWRVMTGGGSGGESAAWDEYVSSFRSPMTSSGQVQKWQPDSAPDGYDSKDTAVPSPSGMSSSSANEQEASSGSTSADHESENGRGSGSPPASSEHSGYAASESSSTYASANSEGSSTAGSGYVSAMAVMPSGPRRSALLPRMSRFDIDALNREIAELHEEIRALLPIGHDQAERAQHLLDKAHTIADSDPERSAEVEYYMQQVRMIVTRTRDSRRWSNLYRDRLRMYLLAWALLSTMTLGALWLSQFQIEAMVSNMLGASQDAFFMRNFAGALGSIMAGALGSAIGSLVNMRRHAQSQYGFFDRKYGLRGLTLPIIGALVGLLIYALFATVYHFAGINPSLSIVAMATPALLAFVFGVSQESLYGTTG